MKGQPQPPVWAQRFITWYCKPELAEDLIGDLNEYFERNVRSVGLFRAKLIYCLDAIKFLRIYLIRSPDFINFLINTIMIGNYIKTSGRNLLRNKLFSFINVVGLAISMSVGLLLIAVVLDLRSFDRFNLLGDNIYRITNVLSNSQEQHIKYASTSIKTGKLIQEKVAGIEEVTIIRTDFSKDAEIGDTKIPINGLWAEPSFFRIFTFPMLEGNPDTALKEPFSVVLTESAAKKIFGTEPALGKSIRFDTIDYQVTAVIRDVPFFSHLHFEVLVSLSTVELLNRGNENFNKWTAMWSNYVYLLPQKNVSISSIQSQLKELAKEQNLNEDNTEIQLELIPLYQIVVGEELRSGSMSGDVNPHMPPIVLWILSGLTLVVIMSACFNYTNLSVARAMYRFKEIGLRKAIGATKSQVLQQFLIEGIMISLAALLLSYVLFLVLRPQLINIATDMQRTVKLELNPTTIVAFITFSISVGTIAGILPALFYSKISAIHALKNVSTGKFFNRLSFRRALMVIQYTVTLILITATTIGYVQYKNILEFNLGFNTENILNIDMQGNKPDELIRELSEMPEVTGVSRSLIVTSVGNAWGGHMKYKDSSDSVLVMTNHVDENYLPLHEHQLVAGGNFITRPTTAESVTEVIVNQQVLKQLAIAGNDPEKAIGEEITFSNFQRNGHKMTIVGVMKDFHYGTVDNLIEPVAFMFWTPGDRAIVNVKILSTDIRATLAKIESTWKKIDRVHPFQAEFYDQAIKDAYSEFSTQIKIIGFLAFLAISIASLGLFGMVVFTTETRLKEISIRKVMGASSINLVYLLSRGFLVLLSVSAILALPATYFFFENILLKKFPYHSPVQITELLVGLVVIVLIAFMVIGSQTIKVARCNPAHVLKSE